MIVTGENKNIQRTPCCSTTYLTNPTQTGLGLNLGLQSEWPAINCLSYGMVYIITLIDMCMISLPWRPGRPENVAQLRAHIMKLCRAFSEDLCRKVVTNARVHLQEVVRQNGGHIEHVLH